ncbi:T9SS type A sorting domain-containing protein [Polaribacter aestuariivivens]|uniref:T9SS type A sorting domain-containing protein n=1 Tax=Polaribacter aestuariivivens TaxID=2304626 RepID=UPI003F491B58
MKKILLTVCFFTSIAFFAQKEFVSTSGGSWNTPATWDTVDGVANTLNEIPGAVDNVTITGVTVNVLAGASAMCNNLTVDGSGNNRIIQVYEGASLQVNGDLITNRSQDGVRLSYSSNTPANKDVGTIIIVGETKSDATTVSNRRALISKQLPTSNDWHLISVGGTSSRQNELARAATTDHNYNIVTNAGKFSVGSYNGANAAGSKYEYIAEGTYANSVAFSKIGYAVKVLNTVTAARSNIRLRPIIEDDNASENISDAGDGFNLVGNPFLSYLHANTAADATNNLLTANNAVLEEQTIWIWNNAKSGGAGFETYNLGDASYRIHPLQGFFVKAKSGGGTSQAFNYSTAMQSHDKAGQYFKSTNNRFEIDLSVAIGKKSTNTIVRYIDGTSTSFDNGYDSSIFGGYAASLELYTGLVDGNSVEKLSKQSLPNANFENMIVPVGVTAAVNSQISFTADAINVPEGYKVFLEDRLNNKFTRLDEANAKYTATVTEKSTDGRFFLHTRTSAVLNVDTELLSSVSIYKTNNNNLRIAGLKSGKSNISLYNVLGKKIMNSSFNTNGVQDVSLPKLAKGVYVVQLETEYGNINKKIILE